MAAGIVEPQTVKERLERLEIAYRRLKRWVAVLFLASAAPLLIAVGNPGKQPRLLWGNDLIVEDQGGATRAELKTEQDGAPLLTFLDGKGRTSMALRAVAVGPMIELTDGSGGTIEVTSSTTGTSLLLSKGKGEVELSTNAAGQPSIKLQDRDGKVVWQAP